MSAILKVLITAVLVVAISEVSKRSTLVGGLLASLPLTSLLAIVWLQLDTGDTEKVAALTTSIFWLVLPSLVFFVLFPALLERGVAFGTSMAVGCLATVVAYFAMIRGLGALGVEL